MKINLMHHLSLIYFVTQPLYVLGVFIFTYHQEVFTVYVHNLVGVIRLGDRQLVGSGWNKILHQVGFLYKDYQDVRSKKHKMLVINYCNLSKECISFR
jgi:hypothetical protein